MAESEARYWVLVWVEDFFFPETLTSCASMLIFHPNQYPSLLLASDSAIGLHLLQNPVCARHYDDSRIQCSLLSFGESACAQKFSDFPVVDNENSKNESACSQQKR